MNTTGNCGVAEETRSKFIIGQSFTVKEKNINIAKLYTSAFSDFLGPTGWIIRKDLDFLIEIYLDNLFHQFSAYGFPNKEMKSWLSAKKNEGPTQLPVAALDMETLWVIFLCGILGLGLSIVTFILELIVSLLQTNKKRQTNVRPFPHKFLR